MYSYFNPLQLLLLLVCLRLPVQPVAGEEQISYKDVWNVKEVTTEGGCSDADLAVIDKWHDESGELADNAYTALEAYETDYVVRQSVQAFFGLKPKQPGMDGTVKPSNTKQLANILGNHNPHMKISPNILLF